jgi:hypothetical protein
LKIKNELQRKPFGLATTGSFRDERTQEVGLITFKIFRNLDKILMNEEPQKESDLVLLDIYNK